MPQTLYQCPSTGCNKGQAFPGNDLAEVCTLSLVGITWGLVFNRANLHSGFIPTSQLIHQYALPNCGDVGKGVTVIFGDAIYQCPAFQCNEGRADRDQRLRIICETFANGASWTWVYNTSNRHEGFSPYINFVPNTPTC